MNRYDKDENLYWSRQMKSTIEMSQIDALSELSILFLLESGFFDVNFNCWWQLLLLKTATLVSWVVFRPIRITLGLTIQIFHPFCMALPSSIECWRQFGHVLWGKRNRLVFANFTKTNLHIIYL